MLHRGSRDPKVAAVSRVPMFANFSHRELEFLAKEMDEVDVAAGTTLTTQGKPNHTFHIILEGAANVDVDGGTVAKLGEGDFFGEISMLARGDAMATVVATAPTRLMVLSHEQFRDAVRGNEHLLAAVMEAMAERLRDNSQTTAERARQ